MLFCLHEFFPLSCFFPLPQNIPIISLAPCTTRDGGQQAGCPSHPLGPPDVCLSAAAGDVEEGGAGGRVWPDAWVYALEAGRRMGAEARLRQVRGRLCLLSCLFCLVLFKCPLIQTFLCGSSQS